MFRTQRNLPEIYSDKSRDFQLFCRTKDVIISSTKYSIDSLRHTSNTNEINNRLLPLLKSKLGFFETEDLTELELRTLLKGLPYLVKYKGSKKGIEHAIYLWFRVFNLNAKLYRIEIDDPSNSSFTIHIYISTLPRDMSLLSALFKYLIPTGFDVEYHFSNETQVDETLKLSSEEMSGVSIAIVDNSSIRSNKFDDNVKDRIVNTVGLTSIASYDDANNPNISNTEIKIEEGTIQ